MDSFLMGMEVSDEAASITGSSWNETTNDSTWAITTSSSGGSRSELHNRQGSGHTNSAVISVEEGLTQLTLLNGDPIGPPDVVVQTTTDGGGQIGINKAAPDEALDVNGTTQTTAFKMPTGAADGHVLTSDGDGNGTWQAPGSGGSKAACAGIEQGSTTGSGTFTINFPVTFSAAPYLSAHAVILSGANTGKAAWISASTPGTGSAQVDIQYWDGISWTDLGSGVQVQVSYSAMEK
jgi:hypothetical protein